MDSLAPSLGMNSTWLESVQQHADTRGCPQFGHWKIKILFVQIKVTAMFHPATQALKIIIIFVLKKKKSD